MSDDWRWLDDGETVIWEGRPRLSTIAGSIVVGLFGIIIAGWLAVQVDPWLAAVGVLAVPIPVWSYLRITNTTYLVTTRAIWVKTGVLGRSVRRISLSKVQNTAYEQSVRGSLFGYGTVTIEVAGGRDISFRRVDDPRLVQERIDDQSDDETETDVPGSTDQWRAVLTSVRSIREAVETRSQ